MSADRADTSDADRAPVGTESPEFELVLHFARAAHRAGFPSDDLEGRVEELGYAVGPPAPR